MGTHLRLLSENYPMNTNMTGFQWFSKVCVLVRWTKLASALEGFNSGETDRDVNELYSRLINHRGGHACALGQ